MKLFETIDGLFVGTRYLVWGLGVLGTIGSLILFVANLPLGLVTAATFLASFCLALAVALLLMPEKLAEGRLEKKGAVSILLLVVAVALMGLIYLVCGGFPAVNLLFV